MKSGFTRIAFLLDRSESMALIQDSVIEAINTFVDEQRRLPGIAKMKLVQFNTDYELVFDRYIHDINRIDVFKPAGMTALFDAQCRIIDELGAELAAMAEENRPDKVIVVTMTDGQENSSRRFKLSDVQERIKTQKEVFNWAFAYLGANQDATAVGDVLNIGAAGSLTYMANHIGVTNSMRAASRYVSNVRNVPTGTSVQGIAFTAEDRQHAVEEQPHVVIGGNA